MTILLVEDDDLIRSTTAEIPTDAGHVIVEAHDAESALQALAACPIDVLLADVGLPKISGIALARQARERRPEIHIVFATGDDAASVEAAELKARLLAKPYKPDDLATALAGLAATRVSDRPAR